MKKPTFFFLACLGLLTLAGQTVLPATAKSTSEITEKAYFQRLYEGSVEGGKDYCLHLVRVGEDLKGEAWEKEEACQATPDAYWGGSFSWGMAAGEYWRQEKEGRLYVEGAWYQSDESPNTAVISLHTEPFNNISLDELWNEKTDGYDLISTDYSEVKAQFTQVVNPEAFAYPTTPMTLLMVWHNDVLLDPEPPAYSFEQVVGMRFYQDGKIWQEIDVSDFDGNTFPYLTFPEFKDVNSDGYLELMINLGISPVGQGKQVSGGASGIEIDHTNRTYRYWTYDPQSKQYTQVPGEKTIKPQKNNK